MLPLAPIPAAKAKEEFLFQQIIVNVAALARRFGRVIRFGLVGIGVSLLYTVLTIAFYRGGLIADPTWASAAACLISLPVSFFSHRHITYADTVRDKLQARRFALTGFFSFVIATGSMKIVDLLHRPYWIGLVIAWLLIPASNYLINAIWIFRVSGLLAVDASRARCKAGTAPEE